MKAPHQQPDLFGDRPAGDQQRYHTLPDLPGVSFTFHRRDRRVKGLVQLSGRNPFARSQCQINYRPPASWTVVQEKQAVALAVRWFARIGGIAKITHRVLCHIVARLNEGFTYQPCTWAIDAYASSDWHRQRRAWTTIGRFFADDHLDTWIEKSDRFSQAVLARDQAAGGKRREQLEELQCKRNAARNDARRNEIDQERAAMLRARDLESQAMARHFADLPADTQQRFIARAKAFFKKTNLELPHDMTNPAFARHAHLLASMHLGDAPNRVHQEADLEADDA